MRPAPARRDRGAGDVGHRAGLSRLGRQPRAARRRGRVADPPLRAASPSIRRRWPPASGPRSSWRRVPHLLRLRTPDRDTVLYPGGVLSDLRHGGGAGRVPGRPGPARTGRLGGLDLDAIDRDDAARALVLWSNSPSNPTGGLGDLGAEAAWGRAHGVPVFSDECYAEFTWDGRPARCCSTAPTAWWPSTPSPSARTWPACGSASTPAIPSWSSSCRAVRQHAGLMVPGPAQAAGVAALADDAHVEVQRARYRERLAFLAGVLDGYGCPVALPEGGFYLWVPVPPAAGATPGSWPRPWPRRRALGEPGRSLRRATAPATCGWRWSSPWSGLALVGERLASGAAWLISRRASKSCGSAAADLSPGGHRRGHGGGGGHRPARHGPGPGGRGRRRHRRGRRPRVAQEVDPAALLAARHGDDRARAVRVRRQAAAQARLRRGRRAGAARAPRPAGAPSSAAAWCSCPPT